MHQPNRFWDRIAERYAKQAVADEDSYQRKLAVTRGYLQPDMDVLELGCGTGSTAIVHAPHVKHILAIDISPKMLEIARAKAEASNVANITFERADIAGLSLSDKTFDAVLGLSILHLLKSKEEVIAVTYRMLKPGGVFVTSTACLGDTMWYLRLVAPVGKLLGLMPLVKVFTRKDLESSLTDAGFTIEHQWQPGRGRAVFIVARKAER